MNLGWGRGTQFSPQQATFLAFKVLVPSKLELTTLPSAARDPQS